MPLSVVWWDPRSERLIGHVYKGLGRGDGQLHPHANRASVPHQRHGAQRQHPGLRQRRLHCQDLGHQDGPVPANTARWVCRTSRLLRQLCATSCLYRMQFFSRPSVYFYASSLFFCFTCITTVFVYVFCQDRLLLMFLLFVTIFMCDPSILAFGKALKYNRDW